MAEILVEVDKLAEADCKQITDTTNYNMVKSWLGLQGSEEIAFALVVVDRPDDLQKPGQPNQKYCLLTSPYRNFVHSDWNQPGKMFPPGTQATPGTNEVLVITYPGNEYKGVCTVIGGRPIWL